MGSHDKKKPAKNKLSLYEAWFRNPNWIDPPKFIKDLLSPEEVAALQAHAVNYRRQKLAKPTRRLNTSKLVQFKMWRRRELQSLSLDFAEFKQKLKLKYWGQIVKSGSVQVFSEAA